MSAFPLEALSLTMCVYLSLIELKNISSKGNLWSFQLLNVVLQSETDLKTQNKETGILWEH